MLLWGSTLPSLHSRQVHVQLKTTQKFACLSRWFSFDIVRYNDVIFTDGSSFILRTPPICQTPSTNGQDFNSDGVIDATVPNPPAFLFWGGSYNQLDGNNHRRMSPRRHLREHRSVGAPIITLEEPACVGDPKAISPLHRMQSITSGISRMALYSKGRRSSTPFLLFQQAILFPSLHSIARDAPKLAVCPSQFTYPLTLPVQLWMKLFATAKTANIQASVIHKL